MCRFCPTDPSRSVIRYKPRAATLGGHCGRACAGRLLLDYELGAAVPCGRSRLRDLWVCGIRLGGKLPSDSLASRPVSGRQESLLAWWVLHSFSNVGECALARGRCEER